MINNVIKTTGFWVIIFIAVCCAALPAAYGHPHIFIVQRMDVVFNDKGMSGIRVLWAFDDMFSTMIIEEHDRNKNRRIDPDEVKTIKEQAFMFIAEYNYFIHISIEGRPFKIKQVEQFNALLERNTLIYEFFIPCQVNAGRNLSQIKIAAYDPTYYTAILFAKSDPVSFINAEPYQLNFRIAEDPEVSIYYGMINPWTLFVDFRKQP